jgi:hypothetical protein
MPATFRCYFLDDEGHIRNAEVIEANALSDAIEQGLALLRRSSHPHMEIWDGATKVFPVSAPSAAAADD